MISVIGLTGKSRKLHGHERMNLYTLFAHTLKKAVLHIPATHIIIYQSHLHALMSLIYESIGDKPAQRVILYNKGIDMYVMLGPPYFSQQGRKKLISGSIYLCLIVFERQCPVLVDEEIDDVLISWRNLQVALLYKLKHGPFGEFVKAFLWYDAFLAYVLTEKEIKYDAHDGHEGEHQYPCQGLGRLPVVHYHDNDGN